MPTDQDTLESMEQHARGFAAPVAVVEVRAATAGYDKEAQCTREVLEVHVILAAPSETDSRYRIERVGVLSADTPAAAQAAMDTARRLADRLTVPIHPDSTAPPEHGEPEWLELQGPPPERPWKMAWRTTVWRPDGTTVRDEGELTTFAPSGDRAIYQARSALLKGLVPPFIFAVKALDTGPPHSCNYVADPPAAAPPKETLRAWALEGRPPSAILRALATESPGLSPLDKMVAFEHAFLVDLDSLAPVGAFCRGSLSDAELDATLGPTVQTMKPQWSLPLALHRAHSRGESIGPVLHAYYPETGVLQLIIGVRDAFDLSLGAAKMLVGTACDNEHDEELPVMLNAALRVRGTGYSDDTSAMMAALNARQKNGEA